jgi:hypothetical protein
VGYQQRYKYDIHVLLTRGIECHNSTIHDYRRFYTWGQGVSTWDPGVMWSSLKCAPGAQYYLELIDGHQDRTLLHDIALCFSRTWGSLKWAPRSLFCCIYC